MMRTVEQEISQEYECIGQLGSGAFGYIILVRSKNSFREYACKIEKNHGKKMILVEKEFKMLASLMDTHRFPEVYSYKVLEANSYIIMEKLGSNLDSIFVKQGRKFSLKTLALILHQLLLSVEALHRHGYLHRDIKPENIMTTCNSHTVKLIDFGLAERTFAKQSVALIGNVRFCSRGAHFGYSGKKQDLQNLLFTIYSFLQDLPWQSATEQDIEQQLNRRVDQQPEQAEKTFVLARKEQFLSLVEYPQTKNLISIHFYKQLHELAKQIMGFKEDEEINYRKLIHRAERLMTVAGIRSGDCYDWCQAHCPFAKPYEAYWDALN